MAFGPGARELSIDVIASQVRAHRYRCLESSSGSRGRAATCSWQSTTEPAPRSACQSALPWASACQSALPWASACSVGVAVGVGVSVALPWASACQFALPWASACQWRCVGVGVSVGVSVGASVGVSVGVVSRRERGRVSRVSVGASVGVSVGANVGVAVGVGVGANVGVAVAWESASAWASAPAGPRRHASRGKLLREGSRRGAKRAHQKEPPPQRAGSGVSSTQPGRADGRRPLRRAALARLPTDPSRYRLQLAGDEEAAGPDEQQEDHRG